MPTRLGMGELGSLTVASTAAGGSLTLNGNNTFTGAVTVASGALTIGGANVYTGPTAVNAGTFTLNTTAASLGNTAITVANSATFAAKPGGHRRQHRDRHHRCQPDSQQRVELQRC